MLTLRIKMTRALNQIFVFVTAAMMFGGCSATHIPNTTVVDNFENREVVAFVERYRHAVESANVRQLLEFAGERYYDDAGTPNGDDDIDIDGLRENLAAWADLLIDCRYEIRYREVAYQPDQRIHVTYRYTGSFRVADAEGAERWQRRVGDNRLVLVRGPEGQGFKILSGM
jgi:hypothetical protein